MISRSRRIRRGKNRREEVLGAEVGEEEVAAEAAVVGEAEAGDEEEGFKIVLWTIKETYCQGYYRRLYNSAEKSCIPDGWRRGRTCQFFPPPMRKNSWKNALGLGDEIGKFLRVGELWWRSLKFPSIQTKPSASHPLATA